MQSYPNTKPKLGYATTQWATGGLHDLVEKFNGTCMHMKCSCIDSLIYVWKMCLKSNDRPNGD